MQCINSPVKSSELLHTAKQCRYVLVYLDRSDFAQIVQTVDRHSWFHSWFYQKIDRILEQNLWNKEVWVSGYALDIDEERLFWLLIVLIVYINILWRWAGPQGRQCCSCCFCKIVTDSQLEIPVKHSKVKLPIKYLSSLWAEKWPQTNPLSKRRSPRPFQPLSQNSLLIVSQQSWKTNMFAEVSTLKYTTQTELCSWKHNPHLC